ncbi:MAG: hypothetical protein JWO03_1006 [Bacteroidetes bacterium]|nr:hypothetical protein [Bacteroidota bacterium]
MANFKDYTMKTSRTLLTAILLLLAIRSFAQSAGPDRTISCIYDGDVTMAGTGTGYWTERAGNPGYVNLNFASQPNSTFTYFTTPGTYGFIWHSGGQSDTALVVVTGRPAAGIDRSVITTSFPGGSTIMTARGSGTWTPYGGNPGSAIIDDPDSAATAIRDFTWPGSYSFIWTNASGCSDTAQVEVTASSCTFSVMDTVLDVMCFLDHGVVRIGASGGTPPYLYREGINGTWQTDHRFISYNGEQDTFYVQDASACVQSIVETMSSPGLGPSMSAYASSIVAPGGTIYLSCMTDGIIRSIEWYGPPGSSFSTAANPAIPNVTDGYEGYYQVKITDINGCYMYSSGMYVAVAGAAGVNQNTPCTTLPGGSVTMSASGTGTWAALAGNPGTATIVSPTDSGTVINAFSTAGTYGFVWTYTGGLTDTVLITVKAKPNAGVDRTASVGGSATMAASGTGSWYARYNNPSSTTITSTTSPTTTITSFSTPGTYYYIWTNSSGCTDTAAVVVTAAFGAGPDQTLSCISLAGGSSTMAAMGTGTWSARAGNPGTATSGSATSATTTITTFSAAGTYGYIWTGTGGQKDTMLITITAKPNAGADKSAIVNGQATMAATGAGTWTALSGNPGTATITTPTSATTTITLFSTTGTYRYIWTNSSGCKDTAAVVVTNGTISAGPDRTICQSTYILMQATGSGTWTSLSSNPSITHVSPPTSPTGSVQYLDVVGTYGFVWTSGSLSDTVYITTIAKPYTGGTIYACSRDTSVTTVASGTGVWRFLSGPAAVVIADTTAAVTTIRLNGTSSGFYYFSWVNSAGCSDSFRVYTLSCGLAGVDQSTGCPSSLSGSTVTMDATGTGSWAARAGNPGTATITSASSPNTTITNFSTAGIYGFVWTSSGGVKDTALVNVSLKPNGGADKTASVGGTATMAASGTGYWGNLSTNPGSATITSINSSSTTITSFSALGTYLFLWVNSGGCQDTVAVVVSSFGAGPDRSASCVTLPGGSVTMAGWGSGTWTARTGNPGTATITSASSATTTITTFSAAGTYGFVWTAAGGQTDTALVTITSVANGGPDQTASVSGSATMAATGSGFWWAVSGNPGTVNITDIVSPTTTITGFSAQGTYRFAWNSGSCPDTVSIVVGAGAFSAGPDVFAYCVVPTGGITQMAGSGTGTWSARAGNPGTATIMAPTSPTTYILSFSATGVYGYVWTAAGGQTDTALVNVLPKPNAGADQFATTGNSATMAATGAGTWTAQPGNPGTATITTPASPTTTITAFSAVGTYYYIWTNSSGCNDTAVITVTSSTFSAGPDRTVSCITTPGGSATMAGTGSGTWTARTGNPGTASIVSVTSPTTSITTFSAAGVYGFVWTASGGQTDTMLVTVTVKPNAGIDQSAINGGSTTMAATGAGTWTAQSGNPSTTAITTSTSPTTTITAFSAVGTFYYIWTNSSGCSDTAAVIVTSGSFSAGPDRTVSCVTTPGGSATMAGTGSGTWTARAGNPGTASIASATSPITSITTFSAAGVYGFVWTSSVGQKDTALVTVTAKPNAGTDQSATTGGSATMAATGTGTWTALSGNPGTATITSPTSPTTTISAFSSAGTYRFRWTSGGCADTAAVVVSTISACGMALTDSTHRPSCSGSSTGEVFLYITGGTAPYQYKLGFNGTWQTSNQFTNLSSGARMYYVKDATGCTDSISITLTAGFVAVPSISYIPLGNRTYQFTANDLGFYNPGYWWAYDVNNFITTTTGPKTVTYTYSTTGAHSMWVMVGEGTALTCSTMDSVSFIIPSSCSLHDSLSYTALGGTQYSFSAHTTGATRPGYFWTVPATWTHVSGAGGSAVYSVPSSGIYSVTLTTVDSTTECGYTQTINVNLSPSCSLVLYDTLTDPACVLNSGVMRLTAAGTPPYQYRMGINGTWQSSNIFSGLFAGIDTFYAMDAGSCVVSVIDTLVRSGYPVVAPASNSPVGLGGTITLFRNGSGAGTFPTTSWTGPNGFTSSAIDPTISGATAAATGIYTVKYGDVFCKVSDSILVMVGSGGAGLDKLVSCVTLPGGVATMLAYGSGTWTALPGNPGTATITNPSDPATPITSFSAAGVYTFLYTTTGPQIDTARITVTTMPDAGPDRSLSCAPLSGGSVTMAATGTGTWTIRTGNPGTSHITSTTSPTTTVTTFSAPGTYYYIWTNAGGCKDTAAVTITSIPNAPVLYATGGCPGTDTITINVVPGTNQITWLLNGGIVHTSIPTDTTFVPTVPGSYTATVTSGLCQSAASNATTLLSCLSDSVWPGDANHDGVADNNDLLPIGIAYGLNGFTRPDQSIVWNAHYAADWGVQFVNGTNTKHADCDGNAVVDANDTTAILLNFGLTHTKTGGYGQPWRSGAPGIKLEYSKDTVAAGDTLTVSMILGDSITPATNIYGFAFNYHYDPLVLDTATTSFGYINSFLGNSTNMIQLHKDFKELGIIRTAVTGINHLNRSGYGIIGHFRCIITTDNINGKDLAYYGNINFISDIIAIDKDENPITLNAGLDSNRVAYEPTGIRGQPALPRVNIYPNPASDRMMVNSDAAIGAIVITDILGQDALVQNIPDKKVETLDISSLTPGVYTVHISTIRGSATVKLIIAR